MLAILQVQGLEAMVFDIEFWLAAAELQSSAGAGTADSGKNVSKSFKVRPPSPQRKRRRVFVSQSRF